MKEGRMKQILVLAKYDQAEALRVAAGQTLLDDQVRVDVIGDLEDSAAVGEQKEVLDFADVPCDTLAAEHPETIHRIARHILAADVVFLL
jgi:hypothetical protein